MYGPLEYWQIEIEVDPDLIMRNQCDYDIIRIGSLGGCSHFLIPVI